MMIPTALVLLASATTGTAAVCDFQGQCYGDTSPGSHAAATAQPQPRVCHLVTIRTAPALPSATVEMCAFTPADEEAVRKRVRDLNSLSD